MFSGKSASILIAILCAAILLVIAISRHQNRKISGAPQQSTRPMNPAPTEALLNSEQAQPSSVAVPADKTQLETPDAVAEQPKLVVEEPRGSSSITAFREWADTAATVGQDYADLNRGMELAQARASDMKALIKSDPQKALRLAMPTNLRAALPPAIAASIEQPVKKNGTVTIRMTCNHSPAAPHTNCKAEPVLQEEIHSWNVHYDVEQWRAHLGQTVELDGIAVGAEVAVQKITPIPVQ